jgi:endo-1,4-beta-xylanase
MNAKRLCTLVLLTSSFAGSWVGPTVADEKNAAPAPGQSAPAATKSATNYNYGSMEWIAPDRSGPAGTQFKTFHSNTINADVSYLVYLPPDYEKNSETHYPVLYELHASGGMPSREARAITPRFDRAMRSGKIPPMIIVYPNGLRGATMYSDTKNGEYPVESVIIKDLIPHIDATYRTIVSRAGRALDGFSMGGFGAAHLGFKYPELFGVVSIQAPPLLGPDLTQPLPTRAWSKLFHTAMGGDLDYFRQNDPFALAAKNADALRDRSFIRIVCHIENENWLAPQCEKLHQVLMSQTIPHQFLYLSNVNSHNGGQVALTLGDAGLMFFGSSFAQLR